MDTTGSHQGRNPGPNDREEAMDRDTLETLCQSFAARQASGAGDADPVPEIVRSFRLAEISAAELQSFLGLVADDEDPADLDALHECDVDLDPPPAIVDDFPDFDDVVAAGLAEGDDDGSPLPGGDEGTVTVRIAPTTSGARVGGLGPPTR